MRLKKAVAFLLATALLLGCCPAMAEEAGAGPAGMEQRLRIATTTPFAGNFFSGLMGNNASDLDVRRLIHGYSLVYWNGEQGIYDFDSRVVSGAAVREDGRTYVLALAQDLTYNDGTPITAADYAFSILLQTSGALEEATGVRIRESQIEGFAPYVRGETAVLSGLRILGDYSLSITIDEAYRPYFYELDSLNFYPLSPSLLAPGCEVRDEGEGAFLSGTLDARALWETLLNAETGYISHPTRTTGPYQLAEYTGDAVRLTRNPSYKGDENGEQPRLEELTVSVRNPDTVMQDLTVGDVDLVVRCLRASQVDGGISLVSGGDIAMASYNRNGLAYISFCGEKGPAEDVRVRQAIAHCMDREEAVGRFVGPYGLLVDGYYGLGQWMYLMANGTYKPEDDPAWETVHLDGLTVYDPDPEAAARLLEEAGWNLNEAGEPFVPGQDALRCRRDGEALVPLKLKLIYPEGNGMGAELRRSFGENLARVGAELRVEEVSMPELQRSYLGQTDRDCDMILLGNNFADVFDPLLDYDETGRDRLNGIADARMMELSRDLRETDPGDVLGFVRKWVAFQEYRTSIAMEIPLYSNAYFDFFVRTLRNYAPGTSSTWTGAILKAYLSEEEPAEEAPGEDEADLEDGDFEDFDDFG